MLLHILYRIVLVLAVAPLAYYLLSLYCVVGYFRELRKSTPGTPVFLPPASILKPVRGVDHQAYENFASYCQLDYPEYEIIFAVADPDDPVIPLIEKLQRDFPDLAIRFVTDVARVGENNKGEGGGGAMNGGTPPSARPRAAPPVASPSGPGLIIA